MRLTSIVLGIMIAKYKDMMSCVFCASIKICVAVVVNVVPGVSKCRMSWC